jgi:hypothetical protein
MKITHSKWMLLSLFVASLSGCGLWDVARQNDAPPPPNVRGFRALQIPADLRVNRPPSSPTASELARALAPAAPVVVPAAVVPEPVKVMPVAEAPSKGLFSPYFPTSATSSPPNIWTAEPKYDFPWVNGAVPTRVNEEVTFGSGALMLGRLYAKVTFGGQVLPASGKSSSTKQNETPKQPKGSVLSRVFKAIVGGIDQPDEIEKSPDTVMPVTAESMSCSDVTCLDVARDMLVDDARSKGWNMIFNRRVSMHQSYQFSRDGRLIGIEVNSTGGRLLTIEYNLMPAQQR